MSSAYEERLVELPEMALLQQTHAWTRERWHRRRSLCHTVDAELRTCCHNATCYEHKQHFLSIHVPQTCCLTRLPRFGGLRSPDTALRMCKRLTI